MRAMGVRVPHEQSFVLFPFFFLSTLAFSLSARCALVICVLAGKLWRGDSNAREIEFHLFARCTSLWSCVEESREKAREISKKNE